MRKPPPLTDIQRQALDLARRQGGRIFKNAAAWGPEKFDAQSTPFDDLFGTATVRSLVTRGAMRWLDADRTRAEIAGDTK